MCAKEVVLPHEMNVCLEPYRASPLNVWVKREREWWVCTYLISLFANFHKNLFVYCFHPPTLKVQFSFSIPCLACNFPSLFPIFPPSTSSLNDHHHLPHSIHESQPCPRIFKWSHTLCSQAGQIERIKYLSQYQPPQNTLY